MKCFKSLTPVYRLKVFAVVVLAFIAMIQVSIIPAAVETGAPVEEFTAHLNRRIPKLMKRYDIPGVTIALVRGGKTVWAEAYGYADIVTGRKMTVNTPCRGESISKSITALAINQDYLALTSVFPVVSNWLGFSLLLAAVVFLLTASTTRG